MKIAALIGALVLIVGAYSQDCPSFFGPGNGNCTIRQCLNGGYLNSDGICVCPSGYLGIHCEPVKTSLPPDNHFKAGGTSFNIINVNLFTQYWGHHTYSNVQQSVQDHFKSFPSGYNSYNLLETSGRPSLDNLDIPVYDSITWTPSDTTEFKLSDFTDSTLYWCYEVPLYEKLIEMVQKASLKNTVITIITQHTPLADKLTEAREIAVAFGIRINVLFFKDETFNRCTSEQISSFKAFSDITGGLFVELQSELNDAATENLVSQLLLTHYQPQYISIQSFDDCTTSQSVPVVIDPTDGGQPPYSYNFVFLGANARTTPDSFRSCSLRPPLRSFDNQLAIFQSPDPMCSSVDIQSDSGSCTAIVFTNTKSATGPLNLAVYTTYIEDQTIDASRYAIVETVPFFPAFHVESSSSVVVNSVSASYDKSWNPTLVKRDPAAYEWSPNKTISCDSTKTYSLLLNISVNAANVQRAVRVACVPTPPPPTAPSTVPPTTFAPTSSGSSSSVATTLQASTSTVVSTSADASSSTSQPTCKPDENYSSFLFAYSTDFNAVSYNLAKFPISNAVSSFFPVNQTLANVPFDLLTQSKIQYSNSAHDFTDSLTAYQVNDTLAASSIQSSNALDIIKKFLSDTTPHRLEGSTILLFVNRLPAIGADLGDDDYDKLTNMGVKIFPMTTVSNLYNQSLPGRSVAVLNRIAAQTNGHFIVANDIVKSEKNSDFNKIVLNVMQTSYNQNLLFTRNIGVGREGTDLGTVRIPQSSAGNTVTVTITASLSAVGPSSPQPPMRLLLGIKPNSFTSQSVSIDFINSQNVTRYENSNFYVTTVELDAGIARDLFLSYIPGPDSSDLLIRMWTTNNVRRDASFVNIDGTSRDSVDENSGAALRINMDNSCSQNKQGTLLITDCNGRVSAKYDSDQTFDFNSDSNFYQFVPYFCDSTPSSPTCVAGAERKYDAQFVSDSFSFTRSFQCRNGSGPIDSCKLQDSNGNYQCSGVSPFKRGPTGSLTDCSNHGHLVYSEKANNFSCLCDPVFSGASCEIVSCAENNNDPLAVDNSYHTYTVVLGLDVSVTISLIFEDAKNFFGLNGKTFSNVWKYQLLSYCVDGGFDMIYSGSDLTEFTNSFDTSNPRACNKKGSPGSIDLTTVYKQAVKGIGRNVKGVMVYYSEVSNLLGVQLDEFVAASQPYQQQLFVYGVDELPEGELVVPMNKTVAQAAMSTGGFLIQSLIDTNGQIQLLEDFIPDLLSSSSSIAWFSSSQTDTFSYSTATESATSYFITWQAGLIFKSKTGSNYPSESCEYAADTMAFCKIHNNSLTINSIGQSYYVAVYVLNDVAPKAQIISDLAQDSSSAVSTSSSDTRTMLSILVPNGFTLVANSGDDGVTRNAQRTGCTFGWTAYSVFASQKYQNGANIAQITLEKTGDSSKQFTRFFSFGTSSSPNCQNGGSAVSSTGSCDCPSGFQGPDCSLVNCSQNSTSNAWSDVCVCSAIDDVTCANQYTSII